MNDSTDNFTGSDETGGSGAPGTLGALRALGASEASESSRPPDTEAWGPLSVPVFRTFWLASLGSNIGTWINGTASGWVMTDLSSSPVMVSLVQAANSLPIVLFALIAGALTDILDRRRYLMVTQAWLALSAAALTFLAATDMLDAWSLLILTFSLGLGAAMATPALNVTAPELVPGTLLPQAIALGSLSMNVSRSIGPAVAGLLLAQFGAWAAYGLNTVSFIGMITMLWRWRHEPGKRTLPPERFFQALRSGLRYARSASPFRAVLIRTTAFILFAASVWALLPLIARHELASGPETYGLLLTFVGIGAIAIIIVLPKLHAYLSRNELVLIGSIVYALSASLLAVIREEAALYGVMALCGASVGQRAVIAAGSRTDFSPGLGPGTCVGPLSHDLLCRLDAGQCAMGVGGHPCRHPRCANPLRCRRAAGCGCGWQIQPWRARSARPDSIPALAAPPECRGTGSEPWACAGDHTIRSCA